jgi:hypothetical protein
MNGLTGTGTGTGTTAITTATDPLNPMANKLLGQESTLSNWAGPYVTDMLGKGQALSNTPYQAYQGPLTAGSSGLQQQAFSGLAGLALPSNMGAYTPQTFGAEQAEQYMNPYLQASLDPQIAEARRQAEISRVQNASRMAQAGAFGGSRQAILEAEGQRNLGTKLADITGTGYNTAYDKAMAQFNTEQGRQQTAQEQTNKYGMDVMGAQMGAGAIERGITSEDIAARQAQFEAERDDPFKKVQYQQSLLQGLPLATAAYSYSPPSTLSNVASGATGLSQLYNIFAGTPKTTTPG